MIAHACFATNIPVIRHLALPLVLACGMLSCQMLILANAARGEIVRGDSSEVLLEALVPGALQLVSFSNPDSSLAASLESTPAVTDNVPNRIAGMRPRAPVSEGRPETSAPATGNEVRGDTMFAYSRSVLPLLTPPAVTGAAAADGTLMRGAAVGGLTVSKFRSPIRPR